MRNSQSLPYSLLSANRLTALLVPYRPSAASDSSPSAFSLAALRSCLPRLHQTARRHLLMPCNSLCPKKQHRHIQLLVTQPARRALLHQRHSLIWHNCGPGVEMDNLLQAWCSKQGTENPSSTPSAKVSQRSNPGLAYQRLPACHQGQGRPRRRSIPLLWSPIRSAPPYGGHGPNAVNRTRDTGPAVNRGTPSCSSTKTTPAILAIRRRQEHFASA